MEERRNQNDDNFDGDANVIDGIDDAIEAIQDGLEAGDTNAEIDAQVDLMEEIKDEANEQAESCRKNVNKVQQGVLCILASGKASNYAALSNNVIVVKVKETETG